uniref:DDB1- and CUL4-associated factor 6-like n=1 Tax=Anopheles epiroticus TaxID=199890 RepID=A0A182PPW2_9DIPT
MSNRKRRNLFHDLVDGPRMQADQIRRSLQIDAKNSLELVRRMCRWKENKAHQGCVNTLCWSTDGELLLSGSDDQYLALSNVFTDTKQLVKTRHRANIFSALFLPQSSNRQVVSCSGDGVVLYTDLNAASLDQTVTSTHFGCHNTGTAYEVLTVPTEPRSFMSCGEDGTVRLYDLRCNSHCYKPHCRDNVLISSSCAITAMALAPISHNYIATGSSASMVRIYDRRFLAVKQLETFSDRYTLPVKVFTNPGYDKRAYRVTSLEYDRHERELLVNYSSDHLYLFDVMKHEGVREPKVRLAEAARSAARLLAGRAKATAGQQGQGGSAEPGSARDTTPVERTVPVRRVRLRGDWSDTGPNARPASELNSNFLGQARPQLQATVMSRITEVMSRMLADPRLRMRLTSQAAAARARAGAYSREMMANMVTPPEEDEEAELEEEIQAVSQREAQREAEREAQRKAQRESQEPQPSTSGQQRVPPGRVKVSRLAHSDDDDDDDEEDEQEDRKGKENDEKQSGDKQDNQGKGSDDTEEDAVLYEPSFDFIKQKFVGHRNTRTLIKEATFWGDDFVMAGSDCGGIFTWNRHTAKNVMIMCGDQHVVNCVRPHPTLPILATSGIDHDIKLWMPIRDHSYFDEEVANDLMKRNALMMEETRDIITVPASFMIRMLACLHSLRNRAPEFDAAEEEAASSADDPGSGGAGNEPTANPQPDAT